MSVSFQKIEAILERFPPQPEYLISALQDVQAEFKYIPADAFNAVCEHLGVSRSQGWAVATFFKSFSLGAQRESMKSRSVWAPPVTLKVGPAWWRGWNGN